MSGYITPRGKNTWRLQIYTGTAPDGKRRRHTETVHGGKKAAPKLEHPEEWPLGQYLVWQPSKELLEEAGIEFKKEISHTPWELRSRRSKEESK